ncbi:MAG: hypothetical protein AAGG69_14735 [Pseudomonadota bacterium]
MLVTRIIYYLIVSICIGISLYLTYQGFIRTLGELTLPFTIVIGLVLFLADFLIQRYREGGNAIWFPLILFLMGAFFSMTSNFNHVYTLLMTRDVAADTIRTELDIFRDDMIQTRAVLSNLPSVRSERATREAIETELGNMYQQATDPNRPGCGTRCRQHIRTINAQLTIPPTDLQIPSDPNLFEDFYVRYSQLVNDALDAEPSAAAFVSVRSLQREIDQHLASFESPQDVIQRVGLPVLESISAISEDVERRANSLLAESQQVDHTYIDPGAGRLGEIIYTLRNGFVDVPNFTATLISTILAIFVDILPIAVALIAFRRGINLETSPKSARPSGIL